MNVLLQERYFSTGAINLLGGGPYSGKTTLLRTLLKDCYEGRPFFGLDTKPPSSWCHVVSDRDQEIFLHDCSLMGLPQPTTAHLWTSVPEAERKQHSNNFKLNTHSYGRLWLRNQLKAWSESQALHPGGLVTIDTAMPFVPDARDYASSWLAAQELRDMARKYDCCLLLITHAGKYKHMQSAATPWERIQVSMALIGCTDTTLYVCSPIETQQTKFGELELEEDAQLITMKGRQADSRYWTGRIVVENGTTLFNKLSDVQTFKENRGGSRGGGRPAKISSEQVRDLVGMGLTNLPDLIRAVITQYEVVEMTARSAINRAINTGVIAKGVDGRLTGCFNPEQISH